MKKRFKVSSKRGNPKLVCKESNLGEFLRQLNGDYYFTIETAPASGEALLFYENTVLEPFIDFEEQQGNFWTLQKAHKFICKRVEFPFVELNEISRRALWALTEKAKPFIDEFIFNK